MTNRLKTDEKSSTSFFFCWSCYEYNDSHYLGFDSSQDLARLGVEAGCENQSLYMEEGISAKDWFCIISFSWFSLLFVSFFLSSVS